MTRPTLTQASRAATALFLASLGRAGDVWVDVAGGSDANCGTSPADAWQTITHALVQLGSTAPTPVPMTAPNHPSLVGDTLGYQALVLSPVAPTGTAWTSAVGLTLQ